MLGTQAALLGHEMLPAFTGCLHIMANPKYAYSKDKVVETAKSTLQSIIAHDIYAGTNYMQRNS